MRSPLSSAGFCFARERVLLLWRVRTKLGRTLECDFVLFSSTRTRTR